MLSRFAVLFVSNVAASGVDARLPLYHRLRDTLAGAIAAGLWQVGTAIPTETELAHTYNVAVGTVRKAIDLLVEDGLVNRVQGKGTFVRRPTFSSSLFRFFKTKRGNGMEPTADSAILERSILVPDAEVSSGLMLARGATALRIKRLRSVDGHALLYEEIWLPLAPFSRLKELHETEFGPLLYPLYESMFGIVVTRATEQLTIATADALAAELLKLPDGSPVAIIERLAFDQAGRPVEWRRSIGDGSRFRYEIDVH